MSIPGVFDRRLRCRRLAMVAFIVMLVAAQRARGEKSARRWVEVSSPACKVGYLPMVPFVDSLRVELAGRELACCTLVEPGQGPTPGGAVRVTVEWLSCVPGADRVQVSVLDPGAGASIDRDVSLADVAPSARPRALALAVAELIRSAGQPVPAPPPSTVPAAAVLPASVVVDRSAVSSMHVEGELRVLPTRDTTLWGGRARFAAPWHRVHVDLDVGAGFASARDELGDVFLRHANVGLAIGPRLAKGGAIVDLGIRAELGRAWIHGESDRSGVRTHSGAEWTACAGLRGSVDVPASLWLRPSLAVEAGVVLRGVKGESSQQPVMGMTGYYLLAALGLGVSP